MPFIFKLLFKEKIYTIKLQRLNNCIEEVMQLFDCLHLKQRNS